ncbi:hypothetical protein DSO57_1026381 [Entomophthora muscae]|uniref:Uncharacterized protein n=1 Tax=Entomophthora muscae TaxID=34485 RepID=A0ACC2U1J3_9FUNG|nr:hypothetical protein DSO57_1026381 [Entomophthora muscae]
MKTYTAFSLVASTLGLGPCPDLGNETCLRGGLANVPCSSITCPPCWVPQDANTWGCYEKLMGPNNLAVCPPWTGIIDITNPPSSCIKPTEPPVTPIEPPVKPTDPPTTPTEPPVTPTEPPVKPTDPPVKPPTENFTVCPDVTEDTCFQGSHLQYPCKGKDCPPCWEYKNKQWDCYDPINGKCEWENLVDIRNMPSNCQLPECE